MAPLTFAGIQVGAELPSSTRGPLAKEEIKAYAEASGDPNPIHVNDEFARNAGYPGVFAQGMLGMGYLGQWLVSLCGVGNLRLFVARFSRITWPGETITCRGRVTEKYAHAGENFVKCEIYTENQEGERKVEGTALFVLP